MTVREALRRGTDRLGHDGAETPYLDTTLLLAHCMGTSKEHLFAELLTELPASVLSNFHSALDKRRQGTPVSYIRRRKEFYGREFYVDERVLVPRPDTETVVETALGVLDEMSGEPAARVLDCGTGSGCIAITLAAERPRLEVAASDISRGAEEVFRLNAQRILGRVPAFYRSNLLQSVPGSFHLIVSNPPYLRTAEVRAMQRERNWPEPAESLDGGADGLELVRPLVFQALHSLQSNGYLVLEVADDQNGRVCKLMEEAGYTEVCARTDLAGRRRVVVGRRG
ncbi:MAG: peptide chain release factor N(5)-glutamine methyltransferase [Spirochaetaceae bacterium]